MISLRLIAACGGLDPPLHPRSAPGTGRRRRPTGLLERRVLPRISHLFAGAQPDLGDGGGGRGAARGVAAAAAGPARPGGTVVLGGAGLVVRSLPARVSAEEADATYSFGLTDEIGNPQRSVYDTVEVVARLARRQGRRIAGVGELRPRSRSPLPPRGLRRSKPLPSAPFTIAPVHPSWEVPRTGSPPQSTHSQELGRPPARATASSRGLRDRSALEPAVGAARPAPIAPRDRRRRSLLQTTLRPPIHIHPCRRPG